MLNIKVDANKCSGCRLCEIACSLCHTGVVNPEKSRIRVNIGEGYNLPIRAVRSAGIKCNIKNKILVGGQEIDGCKVCHVACPQASSSVTIFFEDPDTGLPLKCDFCGKQLDPQCVKWCPSGALVFEQ